MALLPITAIVLTYNEEVHIERLVASLAPVERIVAVDSGSTDATVSRLLLAGAEVLTNPFTTQAEQFAWAMEHAGIRTAWTLRIDADEIIGPDLWSAISDTLADLSPKVTGVTFDRRHIFMGRWVRRGGRFPLRMLRLWRTGDAAIEQRLMDEHIVLLRGRSIHLDGEFADHNLRGINDFIAKHNGYATREALDALSRKYGLGQETPDLYLRSGSAQAARKRALKEGVYNRLPFGVGPWAYYIWRLIFQLGILDGKEGRIYHYLQGYWYRYLVDLRKLELEKVLSGTATKKQRIAALSSASGYDLDRLLGHSTPSLRGPSGIAGLPE
ncbi:glycosyltransferase family 2 protein [Altererythrobacter aquiaggeris]|uniref:glycosyltransferase family 2 protein n=1 Tax=Aestuarierythrobacter aquiaggeris TaxID=1898396 RepID=UPI00301B46B7